MRIFLAGNIAKDCPQEYIDFGSKYTLQTFFDIKDNDDRRNKIVVNAPKVFFLDSGAFTFMNSGKTVNWDAYLEEYAGFIKRHKVEHFFELDLDTIIGAESVKKMTAKLERMTGKQCIPVFHACRGLTRWREMCQQYPYVAIGASGITAECRWTKNDALLQNMISIAHSYGARVHGLGYTRLSNVNRTTVPFDSVDSSSCLSGGRYGTIYKFTGRQIISKNIKGRVKGYKELNAHNIKQWIMMQEYKSREDNW